MDRDPPPQHLGRSEAAALLGITVNQVVNLIKQEKIDGHFEAQPKPGRWWVEINDKLEREIIERRAKRAAKGAGADLQTRAEYAEIANYNVTRILERLDRLIERVSGSIDDQKHEFIKAVVEAARDIQQLQIRNAAMMAGMAADLKELKEAVQYFKEQSQKDGDDRKEGLQLQRELLAELKALKPEPWYKRWFKGSAQDEAES